MYPIRRTLHVPAASNGPGQRCRRRDVPRSGIILSFDWLGITKPIGRPAMSLFSRAIANRFDRFDRLAETLLFNALSGDSFSIVSVPRSFDWMFSVN